MTKPVTRKLTIKLITPPPQRSESALTFEILEPTEADAKLLLEFEQFLNRVAFARIHVSVA